MIHSTSSHHVWVTVQRKKRTNQKCFFFFSQPDLSIGIWPVCDVSDTRARFCNLCAASTNCFTGDQKRLSFTGRRIPWRRSLLTLPYFPLKQTPSWFLPSLFFPQIGSQYLKMPHVNASSINNSETTEWNKGCDCMKNHHRLAVAASASASSHTSALLLWNLFAYWSNTGFFPVIVSMGREVCMSAGREPTRVPDPLLSDHRRDKESGNRQYLRDCGRLGPEIWNRLIKDHN